MDTIQKLAPQKVFHYFEEISRIPRGSGNMEQISDYLVRFARERKLWYRQDAAKNVVIIREAAPGYEEEPPVLLQGHMDMVAVKTADCPLDLRTEGLRLRVEGDDLFAEGTSLGGDDGIAVAYILALLDGDDPHPRLEAVITTDEETGMEGAAAVDLSMCRARRMINLDNEEEGVLLTSCAGGLRAHVHFPACRQVREGTEVTVRIEGLLGGHSGTEIHRGRANAIILLGRFLRFLERRMEFGIVSLQGGNADNVIPSAAQAVLVVPEGRTQDALQAAGAYERIARGEYEATDPDLRIVAKAGPPGRREVFPRENARDFLVFLYECPNGVQRMSPYIPGLVQTSLNLGVLKSGPEGVELDFSVRSSLGSEKERLADQIGCLAEFCRGTCRLGGEYPAWEYRPDSLLRQKMIRIYEQMYGKAPRVEAIHAGLECGILSAKLPGLDCVSIGPDMKEIHSPKERLSISSTARVWEYLLRLLAEKEN